MVALDTKREQEKHGYFARNCQVDILKWTVSNYAYGKNHKSLHGIPVTW